MKLNNVYFTFIKILFFEKDIVIDDILVSSKISYGEKNYKYVIGYLFGDYETKPLHVELPKTSTYIKRYDGQTKWICLW